MQVNDFKNIQETIKYEVLQDEKEYLKLLKVIGNNQKYDFYSQLSIYNKEPEARDCATFDMWKKYFGRVVMRGQNDLYRRVDRSRSRDGRVFTDGSDRGNSDEDRRENLGYESKY